MGDLRPYQTRAVAHTTEALLRLRAQGRKPRVLNVAPCGAGKTKMGLAHVEDRTREEQQVLWIAPGKDLVRQPVERLIAEGWSDVRWISDGRIAGSSSARLTVATVQGLEAMAEAGRALPDADLVILDEARAYASPARVALLERWAGVDRVGYDASPIGPGGRGLGALFTELYTVAQPQELIDAGHLAPYFVRAAPEYQSDLAADPVVAWRNCTREGGELTLSYCRDVGHAIKVAEAFNKADVRAAHLEAKHSNATRSRALADLAAGRLQVVTSATLLRQGIDIPEVSCIEICRAAMSLSLWVQMTGRGGRPKERCLVIDLCGAVHVHGHPQNPIRWDLGASAVLPIEGLPPCRMCRECLSWWPGGAPCPICGAELMIKPPAEVKVNAKALIEVRAARDDDTAKRETLGRYVREAIGKGWSPWAAKHRYIGTYGEEPRLNAWIKEAIREASKPPPLRDPQLSLL